VGCEEGLKEVVDGLVGLAMGWLRVRELAGRGVGRTRNWDMVEEVVLDWAEL